MLFFYTFIEFDFFLHFYRKSWLIVIILFFWLPLILTLHLVLR